MFRVLELFSANIRIYKACKHTSYLTVLVKIEEIQAIRGGDNLMVLTTGYLHSSFSDVLLPKHVPVVLFASLGAPLLSSWPGWYLGSPSFAGAFLTSRKSHFLARSVHLLCEWDTEQDDPSLCP